MSSRPRHLSKINTLVIHCAATPNGKHISAETIDEWHKQRGFKRDELLAKNSNLKHIGYNLIVYTNGAVLSGRRYDESGAHAKGHNYRSIGICLIGTDKFSRRQWASLNRLVKSVSKKFEIKRIVGHRDLSVDLNGDGVISKNEWSKICPGFDVSAWLDGDMQPLEGHILDA